MYLNRSAIIGFVSGLLLLPLVSLADTDLSISASASPSLVVINDTAYLSANISNYGADSAQDVIVSSTLAAGLSLINVTTTSGVCSGVTTVTCNLGTIASGNLNVQATVTLEVTVGLLGNINNDFTVTTSTIDAVPLNDVSTASVNVVSLNDSADLSVEYDLMPTWAYQGISATFPLIVVNNGPATALQTSVNFRIPQLTLLDYISAAPSQGFCITALNNCVGFACLTALQMPISVDCDLGALNSGGQVNIAITANVAGNVGDVFQLIAVAQSNATADSNSSNNSSNVSIDIVELLTVEGGVGPGGCFIATAAYGSDIADEVQQFRNFRDKYLLPNALGKRFVSAYYFYSPPMANYISKHENLRTIVRWLLIIPLMAINYPVLVSVIALLVISLVLWTMFSKRKASLKSHLD